MQIRFLLLLLLFPLLAGEAAASTPAPIAANRTKGSPVGLHAAWLKEAAARLTLDQAIAAYRSGKFSGAHSRVLNFGIGSRPVWIHLGVANPTVYPLMRQLSIETAWLDRLDVFVRHGGKTVAVWHVGDRKAFGERPIDSRYFVFNHAFEPGLSDIFIRVQTPDPMVLPMYLLPPGEAHDRAKAEDYSYGFLYGFLVALMAYNVMLYAGLRDARYILYSLYLGMFLLMNISYTGHGFKWIWPTLTVWEQWSNPVLMVLYGISGLFFALHFLDMRKHFPRVHKTVLGYIAVAGVLLALSVLFHSQKDALLVAFSFVSLFTVIMLGLGAISLRSGQTPAQYFLLAAISAMVGAALTALAVWGFIPFNTWTFRAVDIGVMLDATLLALALTYQFRVGRQEKLRAEELATMDPLTGLNNRRAFYDKTTPVWNITLRHNHNLSVVLCDIDRFKRINDDYGHGCGDEVLTATAEVLTQTIRRQDVAARWGGEEFIVLLPETTVHEAATLAERLRTAISGIRVQREGDQIAVTASFGVAERKAHHHSLDSLISTADNHLYQAKDTGRNRVSYA